MNLWFIYLSLDNNNSYYLEIIFNIQINNIVK